MSESATHLASGKVREIYALDDETLVLAASDRISTFDVVLATTIPDKGRVLTGLSAFWFARTRAIVPNHLLELGADGRSMTCRRLEMLPVEFVVRGYLAGSGWKDYRETGAVCGHALPAGLEESARLPEPIVTPATKAPEGHDENIDEERAAALCGEQRYARGTRGRARALPLRVGSRRVARNPPRRHEVRVRRCAGRRRRPRRRGDDPGLVALLARGGVRAGSRPAVLRQAVRARLVRAFGVEQGGSRARSCPTMSSRGRALATSTRSSG